MQQRVRGPWEATPAGQAMSLAMARIRLLVADAYRLGQRGRNDPNRRTAQDVVRDAMADLELALRSIADATRRLTACPRDDDQNQEPPVAAECSPP
jgi:hypothetical protein